MLNKSENSTQIGASKEPTRTKVLTFNLTILNPLDNPFN